MRGGITSITVLSALGEAKAVKPRPTPGMVWRGQLGLRSVLHGEDRLLFLHDHSSGVRAVKPYIIMQVSLAPEAALIVSGVCEP